MNQYITLIGQWALPLVSLTSDTVSDTDKDEEAAGDCAAAVVVVSILAFSCAFASPEPNTRANTKR